MNGGFLAIWHDATPGNTSALTDWYNKEHHFERLRVPGFLRASRYESIDPGNRFFFVLYEACNTDVFVSPTYLERLNNPTPWTRKVMPHYARMSRTICRLAYSLGTADGGAIAAISLRGPVPGSGEDAARQALDECFTMEGVTRCFMLESTHASSPAGATAEARIRGRGDATISSAILIAANRADDARLALETFRMRALDYLANSTLFEQGVYRSVFTASATDLLRNCPGSR